MPRCAMFHLLSLLAHFFRSSDVVVPSHAAHLMESADARGGQDPHEAESLRRAASAWLSVVR
jgi:hypothetical protein